MATRVPRSRSVDDDTHPVVMSKKGQKGEEEVSGGSSPPSRATLRVGILDDGAFSFPRAGASFFSPAHFPSFGTVWKITKYPSRYRGSHVRSLEILNSLLSGGERTLLDIFERPITARCKKVRILARGFLLLPAYNERTGSNYPSNCPREELSLAEMLARSRSAESIPDARLRSFTDTGLQREQMSRFARAGSSHVCSR